ncbi:hypothetical protein ZWY2020_012836 [Hordeum vulgare]|nr:hypothetical protein ZWY2020_012836 [Hordeum vulgare]
MCCYVGKATKIFLCLVTALLLAGLVLGFGLARRTLWGGQKAEPACRWPRCQQQQRPPQQPLYGADPLPVAGTTAPPSNPLTEPAVAVFPGLASSTAAPPATASVPNFGPPRPFPGAASTTAVPPAVTSVPNFGPPSPFPGAASSTAVPPTTASVPNIGSPSPFPGAASSTAVPPATASVPNLGPPSPFPGAASSTAVPPAPHIGPPTPFPVGPGPSSHP